MMKGARLRTLDFFLEVSEAVLEDLSKAVTPVRSQPNRPYPLNSSSPQFSPTWKTRRLDYDLKTHPA